MSGTQLNADGRLGLMLTELRLPTMKRLATELCDQSDREGWPARQLLERLLEQEMNEREVRRFECHRIALGLSADKRLSSFDFSAVPTVSRARIMALTEGHEWLDRGVNLLAFGAPGSGKSHLLSAIGHALIDAGRRVLFTRCSDLVQRLQAARRDLRLPQELAKLDRFDLLILDDLSYVRRDQAETVPLTRLKVDDESTTVCIDRYPSEVDARVVSFHDGLSNLAHDGANWSNHHYGMSSNGGGRLPSRWLRFGSDSLNRESGRRVSSFQSNHFVNAEENECVCRLPWIAKDLFDFIRDGLVAV